MMRTLKQKIKMWKIIAVSTVVPVFFFVVACQDQAESVHPTEVVEERIPANVQETLAKLKAESPKDRFVIISPTGHKPEDFKGYEDQISVVNGEVVYEADAVTVVSSENDAKSKYLILQYKGVRGMLIDDKVKDAKEDEVVEVPYDESAGNGEKVFLVVEQPPSYKGGMDKMRSIISENVQYPAKARNAGIEGSVFVSFIVEKDGTVSNATIIKGISKECDEEALRVVKKLNEWNPGMQSGELVRVKFVMPVKFQL